MNHAEIKNLVDTEVLNKSGSELNRNTQMRMQTSQDKVEAPIRQTQDDSYYVPFSHDVGSGPTPEESNYSPLKLKDDLLSTT